MSNSNTVRVPLVDLRSQYRAIETEIQCALNTVLESQEFILGETVERFEQQMARWLGAEAAVGVASGSDALLLALMALGIGAGDAVLVTPFTFFSTVSAITRLGATPVFVDIDPESYLIAPKEIRNTLDRRRSQTVGKIRALLPVHLFGQCCAMAEILPIAEEFKLALIEDVAQACGARIAMNGGTKFAGTSGSAGCFSFFPSKTLGGFGDGGLIASNDPAIAGKLRMLRMHGESSRYHHDVIGINSRLDALQAAVLSVKQQYLDDWCERRIEKARSYRALFDSSGLIGEGLKAVPSVPPDRFHVFNNFVVRAENRDELKTFLAAHGIQTEIYYPVPLHLQRCFENLGYQTGDFPQAEHAAKEVLALPIYPELTHDQQEFVVAKIKAFYR
ncbi:MAG TPA: DegT/DnrJ/EryC1/StrS family aminotransferase [Candidatus Binatia bacterium]